MPRSSASRASGSRSALWWVYYMLPSATILHAHRDRAFVWGYGQLLIVTAIVATGAGLHVAARFIEHKAHIGPLATVLTVAVPVAVFLGLIYALYYYLVRRFDPFHVWLLTATAGVMAVAVAAAVSGLGMASALSSSCWRRSSRSSAMRCGDTGIRPSRS